jgi:thiamine biosynthesis lipoprotein ApbE
MNSQLDIVLWGGHTSNYEAAFQSISEKTKHYELVLSRYNSQSELYRLNQYAYKKHVEVSILLWNAVKQAANYYEKTQGYFDISQGNFYHNVKQGIEDIEFKTMHGWQIEMNNSEKSVRFKSRHVLLDFGGMGKGILLNEADAALEEFQIRNAFLSFGGSSVLTRGHHPHGSFWPFSLNKQYISQKVWELNNHAISVSSSKTDKEEPNAHIVNPRTGKSIEEEITVVVKTSNPVDAEVLSTSLIAAPLTMHQNILSNFEKSEVDIFENR